MSIKYPVLVLLCLILVQAAFAQNMMTFDNGAVKFSHPSDASVDDKSQPGKFNVINIDSPDGDFVSICVQRDKSVTVDDSIQAYKAQYEKDFTNLKAQSMKFTDIKEPVMSTPAQGFLFTFVLNGKSFENKTLSTVYQGSVIVIVRQSKTDRKALAGKFFNQILSSLKIK